MSYRAIVLMLSLLVGAGIGASGARADGGSAATLTQAEIVNQANAPISASSRFDCRMHTHPLFKAHCVVRATSSSIAVGMPLPQYRLLPFPQLSLLTIPAAVTLPLPQPLGSLTAFGDIRFVDLAVLDSRA